MDDVRLGDEAEGAQVAQADACKDDVAQLPAGGLDHRGVPEPDAHTHTHSMISGRLIRVLIVIPVCRGHSHDEDSGDEEGGQLAEAGKDHGGDGLGVSPPQVLHRDWIAACRCSTKHFALNSSDENIPS